MAARRKRSRRKGPAIRVRRAAGPGGEAWELAHPRCVGERSDDLEEVASMLEAGEDEIARDELLWLLGDCREFVEAHKLLGEIAVGQGDLKLARGHFGQAYEMVMRALPPGFAGPLPYARESNRAFFEAGKGLAWTAHELGRDDLAVPVARKLIELDPADALNLRGMLGEWKR